jgi:two-component system NtrC family response regulator
VPKRLTQQAAAALQAYAWPGNVRELKNAMERLNTLVRRNLIDVDDTFLKAEGSALSGAGEIPAPGDMGAAVAKLEAEMIRRALQACGGNRAEAARRLNINRQLLYTKMHQYGLLAPEVSDAMTPTVRKDDS